MSRIEIASERDIASLVWMAQKSHPYGPYASYSFRAAAASAELIAATKDRRKLVLVAMRNEPVGFVYCRHYRPRFVRETVVELCDAWLELGCNPHDAFLPKLWAGISAWADYLGAAHIIWNCDVSHLPDRVTKSLGKMGMVQAGFEAHIATLSAGRSSAT